MVEYNEKTKEILDKADKLSLEIKSQLEDNYKFLNNMKEQMIIEDAENIVNNYYINFSL